ncbi:hypothetical protein PIB30_049647 [Stylosanthes scabra]|uniref:diacylglycerol O-acyltransferase n=1 Tax=Stylosanthes scabra TaxID=79078 RepID=A0ABU6SH78_9FABA|nr:hypothetical protein [Stylosanthes scabra]
MGRECNESEDEPLTPAGRLFAQPEMRQIIHCVIGTKNPLDIDSFKSELQKSAMLQHPRFTSLLVCDQRGREHWRPTQVDIDSHLLIIDRPLSGTDDDAVNSYLADLSRQGISMEKPLWEIHILRAHNCAVLRVHHSLGDGISLMSMFLASCRKLHDPRFLPTIPSSSSSSSSSCSRSTGWLNILWNLVVTLWFCFEFILRCVCVRDRKTSLSGGAGVELWPRKIATASFSLQDMKTVKTAVPTA